MGDTLSVRAWDTPCARWLNSTKVGGDNEMIQPIVRQQETAARAQSAAQDVHPAVAKPIHDPWANRRASEQALRAAQARHTSGRRRFVDPATCERDYAAEELEFMNAMQEYKRTSGRMFPTWSEVLEVLIKLGYTKTAAEAQAACASTSGRH